MQTFSLFLAAAATAMTANAFLLDNCGGAQQNLKDNQCWEVNSSQFTYESDAGCELSVYSSPDCQGDAITYQSQLTCLKPGFTAMSVNCKK